MSPARATLRLAALAGVVGVVCGVASLAFLWLLERATELRVDVPWLVFLLPVVGALVGALQSRFGGSIAGGNNLVIDTIHDGGPEIPLRMAPMVLFGTIATHLTGGSAGREGTAVQMGASLTDWLAHRLQLDRATRRALLAAGVAGGFGSVFGTPIAGTVFGLEFVVVGRVEYRSLLPALIAALVGDATTRTLGAYVGVDHSHYPRVHELPLTFELAAKWLAFALAIAAATTVFIELTHRLKALGAPQLERVPAPWRASVRMALGGVAVIALMELVGTRAYLGLGVPEILRAFTDANYPVEAFALKLLFTAITLGAGFLGGEVTPLFFVGAALGNVLARLLGIPLEMGAGVGLAAVFAAASNAPLALTIMAVELLGASVLPHVAIVAVLAYVLTGHRGIYPSQRVRHGKLGTRHRGTLRSLENESGESSEHDASGS